MVNLSLVIKIVMALITVGGIIATLAVMQTKQNMNISFNERLRKKDLETAEKQRKEDSEANDKRFENIERRVSNTIANQIKTEKAVVDIVSTLKHISEGIDELKRDSKK